jgi:hypothetical protein
MMKHKIYFLFTFFVATVLVACKKLVQTPEPVNSITASETFSTPGTATSALLAVYSDMVGNGNIIYSNGAISLYAGASADELIYFDQSNASVVQFLDNQLQGGIHGNDDVYAYLWLPMYFDIYTENSVVEGLQSSTSVSTAVKNQLTGEAKFLRAFDYFYLVNLFGNVPLVTTTDYAQNSILPNSTPSLVYAQIITDLKDAQNLLPLDYSISNNERVRANKWAATALLARVYLYQGDWADAATQASAVIGNSGTYSLVTNLNNVFLANSNEAILQLIPNQITNFATAEGEADIPAPLNSGAPYYYLTPQLLTAFEPGDQRRVAWVDSTNNSGSTYYYFPYKYKVQVSSVGNVPEYYMLLRLAEQYLILAEAEANGASGGLGAAITNLNVIRARAGLSNYAGSATDKTSVLNAIYHERQVELFAEWGHRWFDLKRTGQATSALGKISYKQPWHSYQLLYPIPYIELLLDHNLKQNPGY